MNRPGAFTRYRSEIETTLKELLERHESPLYDMIRYHLGWIDEKGAPVEGDPGKALRPGLCLLACESVCGDHAKALPAAASLELVHNYSLIHDDIQDNDEERRHRPTVWKIWGKAQAINAGTAAKVIASMALMEYLAMGFGAKKILGLVMLIEETTLRIIEGQYMDISFETRDDITTQEYLSMIRKKTGALLATSLKAGAMAGCDDPVTAEKFHEMGMMLGAAFQVRDDVLGIWGSTAVTGKPGASDIRKKKKSLPIVHMFSSASRTDREFLDRTYAKDAMDENDVATIMGLLDSMGARERAEALVDAYSGRCLEIIDGLPVEGRYKIELKTITEFLSRRDR